MLGLALLLFMASSCKREDENIFNMFNDVTISFHNNSPYSLTDGETKVVHEGDSLYIDFTIKSAKEDMAVICFLTPGAASPFLRLRPEANQAREFSYTYKMKFDGTGDLNRVGQRTIRVYALNKAGVYIGDGYKSVSYDVQSNYKLFAARQIFCADTTNMDVKSYFSVTNGMTYSFNEGAANADKIDFCLYSRLVTSSNGAVSRVYNVYSVSATPPPFTIHNISSWTKRATKLSAPQTGQAANFTNLRTGGRIITAAKARNPNSLATTTGLVAGSSFYFLTPEGQYGCLVVNAVMSSVAGGGYFILADIKLADKQ